MNPISAKRQRGASLLALLAVIMLGASWFLVSQLNAESGSAAAARKTRNAEVLNRAKQALIGYVAAQATKSFEDNPGALPCPEHAWYISLPDKEGTTGPSIGPISDGMATKLMARTSSDLGNVRTIVRRPTGTIIAPPRP